MLTSLSSTRSTIEFAPECPLCPSVPCSERTDGVMTAGEAGDVCCSEPFVLPGLSEVCLIGKESEVFDRLGVGS